MSAVLEQDPPVVRAMTADDLASVVAIEQLAYDFPWSEGIFRDCLLAGYHAVVLERVPGSLDGYAIMSLAAGEAHLLNLCIHPALRRQGLGRYLLDHILDRATGAGAERIYLEVRPSNHAAIVLYGEAGFVEIGRRRDYYRARRGREDAVVLTLEIPSPGRT